MVAIQSVLNVLLTGSPSVVLRGLVRGMRDAGTSEHVEARSTERSIRLI